MAKRRETKPTAGETKPVVGETKLSQAARKRLWHENGPYRRRCVLRQARGWLEICLRRMEACEADHPSTPEKRHQVSIGEIPDWLAAIDEVLDSWPENEVLPKGKS